MNDRMHALRVVLQSMWNRAGGRYALIMMGLWAAGVGGFIGMDAVFAVGHRRFQHMGLAVLCAPVGYRWCGCGRTELADGRFSYESHDRRTYGGGLGRVRPAARRRHGVASCAFSSVSVVVVDALISIPTVLVALILSVPFARPRW